MAANERASQNQRQRGQSHQQPSDRRPATGIQPPQYGYPPYQGYSYGYLPRQYNANRGQLQQNQPQQPRSDPALPPARQPLLLISPNALGSSNRPQRTPSRFNTGRVNSSKRGERRGGYKGYQAQPPRRRATAYHDDEQETEDSVDGHQPAVEDDTANTTADTVDAALSTEDYHDETSGHSPYLDEGDLDYYYPDDEADYDNYNYHLDSASIQCRNCHQAFTSNNLLDKHLRHDCRCTRASKSPDVHVNAVQQESEEEVIVTSTSRKQPKGPTFRRWRYAKADVRLQREAKPEKGCLDNG
ncbi:MAG: hypothetical protein L6R37_008405 [Teloschistes peruensis]|nr:MAG: hypothetical protein L6R37_008405 [Teloschistes peruensis]